MDQDISQANTNHMMDTTSADGARTLISGYKVTEIGLIPEDWSVRQIGDLCRITTGDKNTQDKKDDGRYPFFVRSQTVEAIDSYSYDCEGVLTAGDGVGTGKIFHYINGKFDFHQRVYLMYEFSEELSGFYFYKYFSSTFFNRIMSMTAKSSVDSVRREMIYDMPIAVPPIAEQNAIAVILSDVDGLISSLETLIAKKQAIKTATMQQLLTGRIRLPQFAVLENGTPKGYKTSELGEIPEDWNVVPFGHVLSIRHGKSQRGVESTYGKYPIYATGGQIGAASAFLHDRPSVLIGRKGTIDKPRFVDTPFWTVDTLFYSEVQDHADAKFIFYKFCMVDWMQHNEASGVPSLSSRTVESVPASFPSAEEQRAIAEVLTDIDLDIQTLEKRLDKTQHIKRGVMQELLTGKTRLM